MRLSVQEVKNLMFVTRYEMICGARRICFSRDVPVRGVLETSAFARLAKDSTSARKLIDHLNQAVLAKAFRGELVPQDPNDEPAGVLLERIRAEHETGTNSGRGRRSRTA